MKKLLPFTSLLLTCFAGGAQAAPEVYTLDPAHTYPSFETSHQGISYWRGKFNKVSGKVWLDREKQTGRVDITIDVASVNFGFSAMDEHARGEDFFDVAKYPTAHYVSDSITFRNGTPVSIDGQLTLHGVTHPVKLDILEFTCKMNPMFKREICGSDSRAEFDRRDFGIGKDVVDNKGKVRLEIQAEAVQGDQVLGPPPGRAGMPPGGPPGGPAGGPPGAPPGAPPPR